MIHDLYPPDSIAKMRAIQTCVNVYYLDGTYRPRLRLMPSVATDTAKRLPGIVHVLTGPERE
jgi:hypothetical protein